MKFKFSMRFLLLLPVFVLIVLRLAITVELPKKWPENRWNVQLVDSNGTVVSSQDESDRPDGPELKPGRYVVQKVFPGVVDCSVNLFASHKVYPGLMICVNVKDDGPMILIDDESGQVARTFIDCERGGTRVKPGQYSLIRMTKKQVGVWREQHAENLKEAIKELEEEHANIGFKP